tara:strand:- start:581 stop:829 length:249 start_codon:yes stop_codon:yes gene_type:complete
MKKIILLTILFLTGSLFAVDIEIDSARDGNTYRLFSVCVFASVNDKEGYLFVAQDGTNMGNLTQVMNHNGNGFAKCSRSKKK